ncbi:MAG TPA: hypothetical protein VI248_00235 [Kineosporiaceae bacterium]
MVRQPALPLWRHVVFVDWHGVLSRSPFWASIVGDARHPLHRPLRARIGRLFTDPVLMSTWMTGQRRTVDVVAGLDVQAGARYGTDYLCRQLERDCRSMRVNVDLLRLLQPVRERAFVVVATDNVDSFAEAFRRLAARPARVAAEPEAADTLAFWARACDDLICSSDMGALKAADPQAFFGPYLAACGLRFADALLVDDRSDNCAAFRRAGGAALRWTMHTDPLADVAAALRAWLGDAGPAGPPSGQPPGGQDGAGEAAGFRAAAPVTGSTRANA